jgi:hypothetical protein
MRGVLFWLAIAMLATVAPAAADTLRLSNCTKEAPRIKTYNEGDYLCLTARSEWTLPGCGTVTFDCLGKCQVLATAYGNCTEHPKLSGEQTYTKQGYEETIILRDKTQTDWWLSCTCLWAEMQW